MRLTFTAGPEVTLGRPITTYKVTEKEPNRSYQVVIHDIYSEEERCILAKATLPANAALEEPTSVAVVTCEVQFFDVLLHKPSKGVVALSVVRNKVLQNPIPSDAKEEIELHRMRCEVASTLGKATDLANTGQLREARQMLVQVQGRVEDSSAAAKPLARHLVGTLGESILGLEDTVTFKKHGKAVMNNYIQSHWQQRSNTTPSQDGYHANMRQRSSMSHRSRCSIGAGPTLSERQATLGAPLPPVPPSLHLLCLLKCISPAPSTYRSKSKSEMIAKVTSFLYSSHTDGSL